MSNAGTLCNEWIADCRANEGPDSTLEDWIKWATNYNHIELCSDGALWVVHLGRSYWLTHRQCNDLMNKIDAGV